MKTAWLVMVGLCSLVAPLAGAAPQGAQQARKQTRAWSDLSVRPSSRVKVVDDYPGVVNDYGNTAYDRLQRYQSRMVYQPAPFADHASMKDAVAATRETSHAWVSTTLHPAGPMSGVRSRVARAFGRESKRDYLVRRDTERSLVATESSYAMQVENLKLIDEELAQLSDSITGGLHIGMPWGNPLLKDWAGLRTELAAVLHQLPKVRPPAPSRSNRSVAFAPRQSATDDGPQGFFETFGHHVLMNVSTEYARDTYAYRRAHLRSRW